MRRTENWLKVLLPAAAILLCASAFLLVGRGSRETRTADQLRRMTGSPARMVWARQMEQGSGDVFVRGERFHLMGFDTEDRRGERIILPVIGNYNKPMFTAQGDRIVFSDLVAERIYAVNWDGGGLQELSAGRAVEVWTDPQTGIEWVYRIPVNRGIDEAVATAPLTRFQLNNPGVQEAVLEGVRVNPDNLQLSQDGAFMSGQFPWPDAGVLDVNEKHIRPLGKGCWTSFAPDNSYLLWIFDGAHRNLMFHTLDNSRKWSVNISEASGVDGHEVYHPRWSNHERFLCITGPYRIGIRSGGGEVSIYAGRFNGNLSAVEEWCRVTRFRYADFYPDLWICPGANRYDLKSGADLGVAEQIQKGRIVAVGRLVEMTPVPSLEDIAPYTRTLVVYRYEVEQILSGTFEQSILLAAHWGIVDGRETILSRRRIGESYRLELEPYSSRRELEGERLVMELSDMRPPLFYDVEGK